MNFITKLFRSAVALPTHGGGAQAVPTQVPSSVNGGTSSRKQLLAVVLRETLLRNSVPRDAVRIELFRTMTREGARTRGIQVRLVLQEFQQELCGRIMELERDFRHRLVTIDWQAATWLQGISWQVDLPVGDETWPDGTLMAKAAFLTASRGLDGNTCDVRLPQTQTYSYTEPAAL